MSQIILTEAVLAPGSIPLAPIATHAIPIPNLTVAIGLYLLSHHIENNGTKEIINNEFKVENQVQRFLFSFAFFIWF